MTFFPIVISIVCFLQLEEGRNNAQFVRVRARVAVLTRVRVCVSGAAPAGFLWRSLDSFMSPNFCQTSSLFRSSNRRVAAAAASA